MDSIILPFYSRIVEKVVDIADRVFTSSYTYHMHSFTDYSINNCSSVVQDEAF
jgi:hypothetical protein